MGHLKNALEYAYACGAFTSNFLVKKLPLMNLYKYSLPGMDKFIMTIYDWNVYFQYLLLDLKRIIV